MTSLRQEPHPSPVAVLRAAGAAAQLRGLHVCLVAPNHGVHCTSTHGNARWEQDPRVAMVDVIGAAILLAQPEATEIHEAAAAAVGENISWVEGFRDGAEGAEMLPAFLASITRQHYLSGYEVGVRFRLHAELTRCRAHNVVHAKGEPCPVCEELEISQREGV